MTLVEKVIEFEKEISSDVEDFIIDEINNLKTVKDVKEYYLHERGWIDDKSLIDLLFDFIIDLK